MSTRDVTVTRIPPPADGRPVIAVVGGGFGGLKFCKRYRGDAHVVPIDRQNHHLFQPLLYQVAMAGLSAPDVAAPIGAGTALSTVSSRSAAATR